MLVDDGIGHLVVEPINMTVQRYRAGTAIFDLTVPFDATLITEYFPLNNAGDLGLFNDLPPTAVQDLVHTLYEVRITFHMENLQVDRPFLCKFPVLFLYMYCIILFFGGWGVVG